MIKKFYLSYIFLIIIFIFPVLHIVIKDKSFSILENRYLEKDAPPFNFESFLSGEFTENLDNYIQDQFPLRDDFVSMKSYFEILLGRKDINGVYLSKKNYLIEMFDSIDMETVNRNIELINNLSKERNVSFALIPTSTEILKDYLPRFAWNVDQKKCIEYIQSKLSPNVNFINPYNILNKHKNEYIYYLTDHHYTSLGAYYCYLEFCKKYHLIPHNISYFNVKEVSNNFLGTLFAKVNLKNQKKDSIHIYESDPKNKIKVDYITKTSDSLYDFSHLKIPNDQYNLFLDRNHPLIKITTSVKNGNKICIVKDSFANSFVPFLIDHFQEIHIIDLRFYSSNINKYLDENNLNEVLLYYNLKNFSEEANLIFIDNSKRKKED